MVSFRDESGQGTVEYVLLLVVVISMIMGGIYQFNDAFRVWANNYFGNYLVCLLETGELPLISGSGGHNSECQEEFKKFNIADGKNSKGGQSIGQGPSDGREPKQQRSGATDGQSSSGSYSVARSSSPASSSSLSSNGSQFDRDRALQQAMNRSALKSKSPYTGSTEISSGALVRGVGYDGPNGVAMGTLDGRFFIKRDPSAASKSGPKKVSRVQVDAKRTPRQKIFVKKKPAAVAQTADANVEMSFGDYFRYLVIAAIIIMLVIVIGGQLSRLEKEME